MKALSRASELRQRFQEDGVVFIPRALDARTLQMAGACFDWTLHHPGSGAGAVLTGTPGTSYQDQANPDSFPAYRDLLCDTEIAGFAAGVFGSANVWLMYEQTWLKDGAATRQVKGSVPFMAEDRLRVKGTDPSTLVCGLIGRGTTFRSLTARPVLRSPRIFFQRRSAGAYGRWGAKNFRSVSPISGEGLNDVEEADNAVCASSRKVEHR